MVGRCVFALHPHQTVFDVPVEAAVPVPAELPPSRAVLAANMETALNAVWDAAPGPVGRIAVVGAGVVGALVGYLCAQIEGTEVTLVDINPARGELARALGLNFALPDAAPTDCDLVIHTSATRCGAHHRAQHRGRRGDHPGAELVRRGHRVGAARRRVPQPPAQARSRARSARSRRRTAPSGRRASGSRPRSSCSPIRASMCCWRRRLRSTICRRGSPIS